MSTSTLQPLTPEALFTQPGLRPTPPSHYKISPCGRYIAYLKGSKEAVTVLDLWCFDRSRKDHTKLVSASTLDARADESVTNLSDAERAERERRRQFTFGISQYQWLGKSCDLVLYADGQAYATRVGESGKADPIQAVTELGQRHSGFNPSPSGQLLSYVTDGDLYFTNTSGAQPAVRVTTDASPSVTNGLPDFLAAEEMHRFKGSWWSECERYLIYCRNDESPVSISHRLEIDGNGSRTVEQRYPFAGKANPLVSLHIFDTEKGTTHQVWQSGASEQDVYLARVDCWEDGLLIQTQDRLQQTLTLRRYRFTDRSWHQLYQESSDTWINLSDDLRSIGDGEFVFSSEDQGQRQALILSASAEPRRLAGPSHINQVLSVDGKALLASGWDETPIENHLYEVSLDGSGYRRLTDGAGVHDIAVNQSQQLFVDRYTDVQVPLKITVASLDGSNQQLLYEEIVDQSHPYFPFSSNHVTAEFGHITVEDHALYYRLTPPANPDGLHPTIVYVYGGPGAQKVRRDWGALLLQLFAHQGFGVLELDNRGSANRGRLFEAPLYKRMGSIEVDDQLEALTILDNTSWADPSRIGVFGHSYGGYMSLMCLCQAGERFKAGAAVAPVADWRLYDTHYTERFMGLPNDDGDAYDKSSVLPHLHKLERPLLLMHGMADDNVLFTHSTMLMSELQKLGKPFDLMTYPGAKHSMQETHISIHRFETILNFFQRNL